MSLLDTYPTQLEWMQRMQTAMRSAPTDLFFTAWKYVDTLYFYVFVIIFVWYIANRNIGIRLLYIMLINSMVNVFAKTYFALPRPCQMDAYIGLYCPDSYGFPSGAAQSAMLLVGIAFLESKNVVFRRFAVLFGLIFCFSRVYLGVHFPTDIVGGLAIGFLLLLVYWRVFPLFEKHWKLLIFVLPIFAACIQWWTNVGNTLGIALGLLAFDSSGWKWPKPSIRVVQLFSVIIGVAVCIIAMQYLPKAWTVPVGIVRGFWLSYLGGWWVVRSLQ